MPQACKELQDEFPGMDAEAMKVIADAGVREVGNGLYLLTREQLDNLPERAWKALQYMRDEWDCAIKVKEPPHDR